MRYFRVIIWFNPNNGKFYHKKINGWRNDYYVGFKNCYGHEVIYIVEANNLYPDKKFKNIKLRLKMWFKRPPKIEYVEKKIYPWWNYKL